MSRLKRYAHSLVSGYVVLAANMLFTFASVPLAFQYLSKAEFGLWALCSQIAGYLALLDFGMSGAQSRILIDYKDEPTGTNYGSTLLTGWLVSVVQGVILLAAGVAALRILGPLPDASPALDRGFRGLMLGQCGYTAVTLMTRVFSNLLWAHQRSDVGNVIQVVQFALNYATMWAAFAMGAGVFSLLWGLLAGTVVGTVFTLTACARLKLFPSRTRWGRPTWKRFRELFAFGKDVFLFALGSQMIHLSQTLLIAPLLGLEAAGVWAVCTRTFTLACQVVWRVLDFAGTPLAELFVRGERQRFLDRFRTVTILTGALAVVVAVGFGACNQLFVHVWTQGKVGWSGLNDCLLAVWSVLLALQRCHCGLSGLTKQLGEIKYLYFVEGSLFLAMAWLLAKPLGITGIITSSLIATLGVSFLTGLRRTRQKFGLGWRDVAEWLWPAGRIALVLVPLAVVLRWLGSFWTVGVTLAVVGGVLAMAGGWLLARYGLDPFLQERLSAKTPGWLRRWVWPGAVRPQVSGEGPPA